jgi:hypothetical protein
MLLARGNLRCAVQPAQPRLAARRVRRLGAASSARAPLRCAAIHGLSAPHGASDPRYAEAHAAVEALLHAAQAAEEDHSAAAAAKLDSYVDNVAWLGERLGLDRVVPAWNAGGFRGHAVQGRLREVLAQSLSLPALSFGQFSEPEGRVELDSDSSRILKGSTPAAPEAAPDFYAVRSVFRLRRADGGEQAGVNTVMGTFELEVGTDEPREMRVRFTRVQMELQRDDGGVETRVKELPAPATVTLRVLLMTPSVTVTRSSLGSLAVLTRREA